MGGCCSTPEERPGPRPGYGAYQSGAPPVSSGAYYAAQPTTGVTPGAPAGGLPAQPYGQEDRGPGPAGYPPTQYQNPYQAYYPPQPPPMPPPAATAPRPGHHSGLGAGLAGAGVGVVGAMLYEEHKEHEERKKEEGREGGEWTGRREEQGMFGGRPEIGREEGYGRPENERMEPAGYEDRRGGFERMEPAAYEEGRGGFERMEPAAYEEGRGGFERMEPAAYEEGRGGFERMEPAAYEEGRGGFERMQPAYDQVTGEFGGAPIAEEQRGYDVSYGYD